MNVKHCDNDCLSMLHFNYDTFHKLLAFWPDLRFPSFLQPRSPRKRSDGSARVTWLQHRSSKMDGACVISSGYLLSQSLAAASVEKSKHKKSYYIRDLVVLFFAQSATTYEFTQTEAAN